MSRLGSALIALTAFWPWPAGAAPTESLGEVSFRSSCRPSAEALVNRSMALLHSFEYDEARRSFQAVLAQDAECAVGHWGIAMSHLHPLWAPPTEAAFRKGAAALKRASGMARMSARERGLIEALSAYYAQPAGRHVDGLRAYADAMGRLHSRHSRDVEVSSLYALALMATADPADTRYTKQRQAGAILQSFVAAAPRHPGLTHYIIHAYDHADLAHLALDAARHYARIAPDSAHALHMPAHIFERLGMWHESIQSNLRSTEAARKHAATAGIHGHWDEEIHGLDFLLTAYLQTGDLVQARTIRDRINGMTKVHPENFKVAHVFAMASSRVALETQNWADASRLELQHPGFPWHLFPWETALVTFAAGYGKARHRDVRGAEQASATLLDDEKRFTQLGLPERALRARINAGIIDAWTALARDDATGAVARLRQAADLEGGMAISDAPILPAAEILGDMHRVLNQHDAALKAYERSLARTPGRRNSIRGALEAATALGQTEVMARYRSMLAGISHRSTP
ncbi:hypothetical protein [Piscinibacter sp.]|uniref:hypothetical protein n=1 Tax=Piscinibacter sp. TaxID=1903157 RepID=UPI002D1661F6|nr:hypothetical protein [Albitalea sp.]HUG23688.1 hypothetical protein [Albitalea sp.]